MPICQYLFILSLLVHLNTLKSGLKYSTFFMALAIFGTVTSSAGGLLTSFIGLRSNAA